MKIDRIVLNQINLYKDNFDNYCKINPEFIKYKDKLNELSIVCALLHNIKMLEIVENESDKNYLLLIREKIKSYGNR